MFWPQYSLHGFRLSVIHTAENTANYLAADLDIYPHSNEYIFILICVEQLTLNVHRPRSVNWFYYFFLTGKFLSLLSFNPKKFYLNIHYWLKYDHINALIANYQERDIRKSRRTQEAIYLLNNSFERLTVSNRTYIRR